MITYPDIIQGSEAWEALRRIRPTASRFDEIITAKTGAMSTSAKAYAGELVLQSQFKFDPDPPQKFTGNANTDNGHEREEHARAAFAKKIGLPVVQMGFCTTDDHFVGCSPDGLLKNICGEYIAGLEIKCPITSTHAEYVLDGVLPAKYVQQVHGSMYVTGLRKWHFVSYFPTLPIFHIIVEWDAYTDKLAKAMDDFRILYNEVRAELLPKLKAA